MLFGLQLINLKTTNLVVSKFLCMTISHEANIQGLDILNSTFCVCADGFQGLPKAFHYPTKLYFFLFASLKLLTNFEKAY
jgi:hypothetical protein